MAREYAKGIPDRSRYGEPKTIPHPGMLLPYVVQLHQARRAGKHFDVRFGGGGRDRSRLFSWATRRLPEPGGKSLAVQQPLHAGSYADFSGVIEEGYGAGKVGIHDRGWVIVTDVKPDKITFIVTHRKQPEKFVLVKPKTGRTRDWLLVNATRQEAIPHNKVHYKKVEAEDVDAILNPEKYAVTAKLDGAAALYQVLKDRIEVLSYRTTKQGKPIVHTYRVAGPGGSLAGLNIPKHLVGSILRGEIYGERDKEVIPAAELGGLLNATTMKSLQEQQARRVKLKNLLFNVYQYGKEPVGMEEPYTERRRKLEEILSYLPRGKFHAPEVAKTKDEAKKMWADIIAGRHRKTREGIVAWPLAGGKPLKAKTYPESDVYVREIFPGSGRLKGQAAGGFRYSLTPRGPVVGEVGTGFSDDDRKDMWSNQDQWVGRVARIRAQEQFPSGAYRAPAFLSRHEG